LAARPAATICAQRVGRGAHWPASDDRAETETLGSVLDGGHKAVKIFLRSQKIGNLDDSGKIRAVVFGQSLM
jgi:hypothetical protein